MKKLKYMLSILIVSLILVIITKDYKNKNYNNYGNMCDYILNDFIINIDKDKKEFFIINEGEMSIYKDYEFDYYKIKNTYKYEDRKLKLIYKFLYVY